MSQENSEIEAIKVAFNPESVAIIGASESERKFSGTLIPNLITGGFRGKIYPINPKRTEIMNLKSYTSIKDVHEPVDLACVIVPSQFVSQVIKECAEKHVKSVIIISAGFGEIGEKGREIQDEMVKISREARTRIVAGPNCEGLISLVNAVWANIFSTPVPPALGEIGVVSQSGGIQEAVLNHLWDRGIGISHCVSIGNEADLGIQDYIKYLTRDSQCKVITLFIEGVRKGAEFKEAAKMALDARKPIVAMKVGRSEKGRLTAISHTGALVGSDEIYNALFKQLNIIRARNLDELIEISLMLAWQPLPQGGNIGAITDSGGISCIIADAISETKLLDMPDFADETLNTLKQTLPPVATPKNPLDVTGAISPEEYAEKVAECIDIIAMDPRVDIVFNVVTYWPLPIVPLVVESIIKAAERVKQLGKPFLTCWPWITISGFPEIIKQFSKEKVPLFFRPENAIRAIDAVVKYANFLRRYEE